MSTRVLLGFVGSPIEVLPEIIVTDLVGFLYGLSIHHSKLNTNVQFFNHERGKHIGVYMLMLTGGNYLCAVFSGIINENMGWQWVMVSACILHLPVSVLMLIIILVQYWCAIINAISFVVIFFGFEETMYHRNTGFEAAHEVDSVSSHSGVASTAPSLPDVDPEKNAQVQQTQNDAAVLSQEFAPPRTYLQKLNFFYTPDKKLQIWPYVYLPLKNYYTYPIVLWASFYHGIAVVCFNALNATASVILSSAPYNFSSTYVGLAYIGPTLGAVVGSVFHGRQDAYYMCRELVILTALL